MAIRQGVNASPLLSGIVLGTAAFQIARFFGVSVDLAALTGSGFVLLGVALWGILRAVRKFAAALAVATSDPFGLQYQQREWWEQPHPRSAPVGVPLMQSYDDGEDKT